MNTLAQRIQQAIDEKGCKLIDLAVAAGVKAPSVSAWLSGDTRTMKSATAIRAARFLDVNIAWLTEGIGPMRNATPASSGRVRESASPAYATAHVTQHSPEIEIVVSLMREMSKQNRLRVVGYVQGLTENHQAPPKANIA